MLNAAKALTSTAGGRLADRLGRGPLLLLSWTAFAANFLLFGSAYAELFFLPLTYDPRFVNVLAQDLLVAGTALGAVGGYVSVRRFVRL